jgi:DNA-binding MarR family transcriptional regulator
MSSEESQRADLLALLGRNLAGEQANRMVLFQQAVADRLGLGSTDLIGLAALKGAEPLSAGQLAEATGLTTGSVTVMIDRLEQAGYVQREKDPTDRRRVLVRPVRTRIEQDVTPLYAALAAAWARALEGYSTQELSILLDAQTRSAMLLQEQTAALRLAGAQDGAATDRSRTPSVAPATQVSHARLLFMTGAPTVTLRGAEMADLYDAQFEGPEPQIQLQGNTVQLRHLRFALLPWGRRSTGVLSLNNAVNWQIDVRGGAYECTFDLRELTLTALNVFNGALRLELNLGTPRGMVPIRIMSGAVDVVIRRPANVATQLIIPGGATQLRFDERYEQWVSPELRWQTANFNSASDGYLITVEGGASKLRVAS